MPDSRKNEMKVLHDARKIMPGFILQGGAYSISNNNMVSQRTIVFKTPLEVTYAGNNDADGQVAVIALPGNSTTAGFNPFYCFHVRVIYTDS